MIHHSLEVFNIVVSITQVYIYAPPDRRRRAEGCHKHAQQIRHSP